MVVWLRFVLIVRVGRCMAKTCSRLMNLFLSVYFLPQTLKRKSSDEH